MALFSPYQLGPIGLANRVVMAPMTRSRAIDNLPNELMANHYRQCASAGLIITEGTAPSPNGLGYPRIPGLFSADQITGWRSVADRVQDADGRIFAQLMHVGRIAQPLNLPAGAEIVAPSAEAAITHGQADLVAFGVPFIANPDLVARMQSGDVLAVPRQELFYSPGPEGFVDCQTAA